MDELVEVETTGFLDNLLGSLKAVLTGFSLFFAALSLLWWNEGNYKSDQDFTAEIRAQLSKASARKPKPKDRNRPLFFVDYLHTPEVLQDPITKTRGKWLILDTTVAMYQWVEVVDKKTKKNLGGSKTKTRRTRYEKRWSYTPVDSNSFKKREGHINPKMDLRGSKQYAKKARFGRLDAGQVLKRFSTTESLKGQQLSKRPAVIALSRKLQRPIQLGPEEDYLYFSKGSPASPQIGDYRVKVSFLPKTVFSVIGALRPGNSLLPYNSEDSDRSSFITLAGKHHPKRLLKKKADGDSTWVFVLRAVGFFIMWLGLSLCLSPIGAILDVVPFLGSVGRFAVGLVTFIIAALISIVTIVIAWIAHRPIVLVLVVGLIGVGLFLYFKKLSEKRQLAANARTGSSSQRSRQAS